MGGGGGLLPLSMVSWNVLGGAIMGKGKVMKLRTTHSLAQPAWPLAKPEHHLLVVALTFLLTVG